jgi:sulfide:quinone oxidoreductase
MDDKMQAPGAPSSTDLKHAVLIIGGGAAGITVAAELHRHRSDLDIAIVEPSDSHSYQPGWTLVGAGVFSRKQTERSEQTLIPPGVTWIKAAVDAFLPDHNAVRLRDGRHIRYGHLVACPGLKLDWAKIEGLEETLGRNGVCSNYRPDTAEYTWELIKGFAAARHCSPSRPCRSNAPARHRRSSI